MPERTNYTPAEAQTEKVDATQVTANIAQAEQLLPKLRQLPAEWQNPQGLSRDECITQLEDFLDELYAAEASLDKVDSDAVEPTQPTPQVDQQEQMANPGETETINAGDANEKDDDNVNTAPYLTINGVHIPIMQSTKRSSQWEAVPGKMKVSGGEKFSEVKFVKDVNGLTFNATPGEKMTFREELRDQRLESIDTLLQGRAELKAFNEIYSQLATITAAYNELNPHDSDYDQKASELAGQLKQMLSPEGVLDFLSAETRGRLTDEVDFAERASDIIRVVKFLREVDDNQAEFIPAVDQEYKLTPFLREKFVHFASLLNRQMGVGNNAYLENLVANNEAPPWDQLRAKGMTMIVGPRGSGKNKMVEYYSAVTQRPLYRYACSPDKEERDLTYDVELEDGEVIKVPTRILTAISTPNAILEMDEINLLRPEVAKYLNSLLDGDRAIFLNDQVIKVAPGVLLVGLMNPADYAGVADLPETIDDRANVMRLDYPPLRAYTQKDGDLVKREVFTADEALVLKDSIAPLASMDDETFIRLWDLVVNGIGQGAPDPVQKQIVVDIKNMVLIADRARQAVDNKKRHGNGARLERDMSLRGMSEAAKFYSENHLWDRNNLQSMPDRKPQWTAAAYAMAHTFLPHTDTYARGKDDSQNFELILTENI